MALIADTVLCAECIIRKANIAPLRVEEVLVELQRHLRITAISACRWCLRATATYALFH